jgi:tetratricopeptide (TPR) repeat protein
VTVAGRAAYARVDVGTDDATRPRSEATPSDELRPGRTLGRYVLLRELGRGGHGRVFAAHDRVLEREVALKLLVSAGDGATALAQGWHAALAEAQALARLSHPNVVTVHDVGVEAGYVWMSMEKVDGVDLATHLGTGPRDAARTCALFADAARGVAAAHSAGIIHRDIKPGNLLVDRDGRVRVADFGLGRLRQADPSLPDAGAKGVADSTLGVGTPTYMAPEQYSGGSVGPATDVYALCVSLYEALVGRPPFHGADDLAAAKAGGLSTRDAGLATVPPPLRALLCDALAVDPARRPSLTVLLATLEPRHARGRWTKWGLASGVIVLVAGGVAAGVGLDPRASLPVVAAVPNAIAPAPMPPWCRDAVLFSEVWSPSTEGSLTAALRRVDAEESAGPLSRVLDARASQWSAARAQLCEGAAAPETFQLRADCLDARRDETEAALAILLAQEELAQVHASALAQALGPIAQCQDLETLVRKLAPPADPEVRRAILETTAKVYRAQAYRAVGRYAEGSALASEAAQGAEALQYAPLRAEALYALATMQRLDNLNDDATATLFEAIKAAQAGRADAIEAHAWLDLSYVHVKQRDAEDGERFLGFAEAAVQRLPPTHATHVDLWVTRGALAELRGDLTAAEKEFSAAVSAAERIFGPEASALIRPLSFLGGLYYGQGRHELARDVFARALAVSSATEGPAHPNTAAFEGKLAAAQWKLGQIDEARTHFESALSIRESALDARHPDLARAHMMLGVFSSSTGDLPAAERHLGRAIEIYEARFGPSHATLVEPLESLCLAYVTRARYDDGEPACRRAVEIAQTTDAEDPKFAKDAVDLLAHIAKQRGHFAEALDLRRRAFAMAVAAWGEGSARAAASRTGVGSVLIDLGHTEEGVAELIKATAVLDVEDPDSAVTATAWFALAYGYVDLGQFDDARAAALRARAVRAARGDTAGVAEVDAWIARPQ